MIDTLWEHVNPFSLNDVATLVPVFALVAILFYLSNSEIEQSLDESRKAQKLLEKKLEESTRELISVKEARLTELLKAAEFGRFAQGLFHDLISPLTSLILHTEKIKNDRGAQESIEKAADASKRMAVYIQDIRATLSREDSERFCNLGDELDHVLHMLAFAAREKRIEITKEIEPVTFLCSPTKIRQVFLNLLTNSIDAFDGVKDNRHRKIRIRIFSTETHHTLLVEDNGVGIKAAILSQIYEPFFTTKDGLNGTGLGLSTTKNIVEKSFKGTIECKTYEGKGTQFIIVFPRQRESKDPAASHPHR